MAFDASGGDYLSIFYGVLFADEANGGELYGKIWRHEESGEEIKNKKKTDVKSVFWLAKLVGREGFEPPTSSV